MHASPSTALEIAVFARAPVAGEAKTRLAPRLGAVGAARLQAWLTRRALARAAALPDARITLWVSGDPVHAFWSECLADSRVALRAQEGDDLGARMAHAFASHFACSDAPMLLIGTDCPAQTPADLAAAQAALGTAPAVIQPALDGGYVLVGLAAPCPALFAGIAWGSAGVAQTTRERARAAGIVLAETRPLPDLDLAADLDAALAAGWVEPAAWEAAA